ncbi:MAG TPA: hypothetical protein VK038_09285 [Ornithinicoccus sp.]|jgi:hypothetical protein|nr:hypothetical protein [Ornithinicoccus sp.]
MRWTALFDDLEAQLAALERSELEAEIAEHTRAERGALSLVDRLAADPGAALRLTVAGAGAVAGRLVELGEDWVVLRVDGPRGPGSDLVLVPLAAVLSVEGLSGRADPGGPRGSRRLGLRLALRAVSRDRAVVRLTDTAGTRRTGRIERVGRDHLDLRPLPDDLGGRGGPGTGGTGSLTVPCAALAAVLSPGAGRD